MSYALHLAGDARSDLRALDPWLQEDVLDEIESLAAAAPAALRTDAQGEAVHDFERGAGELRHIVFLRLHCDDANQVLTVLAIGASTRPWHGD